MMTAMEGFRCMYVCTHVQWRALDVHVCTHVHGIYHQGLNPI